MADDFEISDEDNLFNQLGKYHKGRKNSLFDGRDSYWQKGSRVAEVRRFPPEQVTFLRGSPRSRVVFGEGQIVRDLSGRVLPPYHSQVLYTSAVQAPDGTVVQQRLPSPPGHVLHAPPRFFANELQQPLNDLRSSTSAIEYSFLSPQKPTQMTTILHPGFAASQHASTHKKPHHDCDVCNRLQRSGVRENLDNHEVQRASDLRIQELEREIEELKRGSLSDANPILIESSGNPLNKSRSSEKPAPSNHSDQNVADQLKEDISPQKKPYVPTYSPSPQYLAPPRYPLSPQYLAPSPYQLSPQYLAPSQSAYSLQPINPVYSNLSAPPARCFLAPGFHSSVVQDSNPQFTSVVRALSPQQQPLQPQSRVLLAQQQTLRQSNFQPSFGPFHSSSSAVPPVQFVVPRQNTARDLTQQPPQTVQQSTQQYHEQNRDRFLNDKQIATSQIQQNLREANSKNFNMERSFGLPGTIVNRPAFQRQQEQPQ